MAAWSAGLLFAMSAAAAPEAAYVRVSPRDPRYFELTDGTPYVPIGLNLITPPGDGFDGWAAWMDQLAANRGNFIRVWLSQRWTEVEHERSGVYDPARAARIRQLLDYAGAQGIRVKLCLEHFRHFGTTAQGWADKSMHLLERGGPARDIADYFDGEPSRAQFRGKLAWFAEQIGARPEIFGWELWNEINATAGGDVLAWSEAMLPELQRLFPRNLGMQSLGSFDTDGVRPAYRRLALMADNDVAQVHRYLDLGARLEICRGPMDQLAADAVRELLAVAPGRPVILAEGGAVEPRHTGPFELYDRDTDGTLLHDVLFAPFFAGAAGPGHIWHWDRYVAARNLWWHFDRFAEAITGIDPPAERFEPGELAVGDLSVYVLRGATTVLAWCRDRRTDWRTELRDGTPPPTVTGERLPLAALLGDGTARAARCYDPWTDRWSDASLADGAVPLPDFRRSLVVRLTR